MSLSPLHVHPLPAARTFAGRENELAEMLDFWNGPAGVLSLIGIGGAGKTALAERFVRQISAADPPEGLFVWSFYDDPDASFFLKSVYRYVTGGEEAEARGSGWFHLLRSQIGDGRRLLFVLDGLERVQRQQTDATGVYGELEDPLLRGFLVRIASGVGKCKAIVTSRFPLASVESYAGKGFTSLDVDQLPRPAVASLLESRDVVASDDDVNVILSIFGSHALTLDLLCGYLREYRDGNAEIPKDVLARVHGHTPEERLTAVLKLLQEAMTEQEVDLLSRLSVFRFGVTLDAIKTIFVGADKANVGGSLACLGFDELRSLVEKLESLHLIYAESGDRYTVHPAVRDHFYRLFRDISSVHRAVQDHYASLSARPGIGLQSDKESLDMLEELIHHALASRAVEEAVEIYFNRLGGNDHLNTQLGEYSRTYRILCQFPECPDHTAMYHCLRAFGQFDEALKWRPKNRYIKLLNGELSPLADDESQLTRTFARVLQGESLTIPDRSPDFPISSAMLHLLGGNLGEARRVAQGELQSSLFEDDRIRNRLVLAEVLRQERRFDEAAKLLDECAQWVLQSSSVEHMVWFQLFKARLHRDTGNTALAQSALQEGIVAAQECGLKLPLIMMLVEIATLQPEGAIDALQEATELASDPNCRFAWGIAQTDRHNQKLGV